LIEPLGFSMSDRQLRRAGLDYHEFADVRRHASWRHWLDSARPDATRLFAFTTHGVRRLPEVRFEPGDWLVFGSESRGLAALLRESITANQQVRLPMRPQQRSLNLSNAVAVVVYEAWRQHAFRGGA
jgi:tRNA (cytidine/uridine-2'-O-)-methyltransferase